jgi:hypothetical protein
MSRRRLDELHTRRVWTEADVTEVWPEVSHWVRLSKTLRAQDLLPLMKTVEKYEALACECFRFARWGEDPEATPRCPACGGIGWSFGKTVLRQRWRCMGVNPSPVGCGRVAPIKRRQGCGTKFADVKGTVFEQYTVPLGAVFMGFYFGRSLVTEAFTLAGQQEAAKQFVTCMKTIEKNKRTGKDSVTTLIARVRHFARLFCGTLLLQERVVWLNAQTVREVEQARAGVWKRVPVVQISMEEMTRRHAHVAELVAQLRRFDDRATDETRHASVTRDILYHELVRGVRLLKAA